MITVSTLSVLVILMTTEHVVLTRSVVVKEMVSIKTDSYETKYVSTRATASRYSADPVMRRLLVKVISVRTKLIDKATRGTSTELVAILFSIKKY